MAVLIVAVVMVVLLGVAATSIQERLLLATKAKAHLQDRAQVNSKVNELTYLIATQRVTPAGISQGTNSQGLQRNLEGYWLLNIVGDEIRHDNHVYSHESGLAYAIQNTAGLIPLNVAKQFWLKRWLQAKGYSHAQQSRYGDTLADYADPDNWSRPAGAELSSYKNGLFTQPANFLLQSCSELWKVMGWQALLLKEPEILSLCSLSRSETLNLNAVPLQLWQVLWPNSAAKIAKQRQQGKWLLSDADTLFVEPALLYVVEDYVSTQGGQQFHVQVNKNGAKVSLEIALGSGLKTPFTLRRVQQL